MIERAVKGIEAWFDRHFIGATATLLFVVFFILFFFKSIFITIPAGHGGALWLRFFGGTVMGFHYGEGTKIIFPWDVVYIYDLRLQQQTKSFEVLTSEGLQATVEGTLIFRLNPKSTALITKYAGPGYADALVMPSVGAAVRLEVGKFRLEELYSVKRAKIEHHVLEQLKLNLDVLVGGIPDTRSEIILDDFWFSRIELPAALNTSIEATATQRQLAEQYVFILQREEQEARRKTIEAQGIRAFQDTVSGGISENYLRWKGIDATLKLADSPNAKIVVIGSGKEGLPLILGPWESSAPAAASGASGGQPVVRPATGGGGDRPLLGSMPAEPASLTPGLAMPVLPPVGLSVPR